MITTKQRAYLRSLANQTEALYQAGKFGVNENLIETINAALEARELIKITVLETCPDDARTVAGKLAAALAAENVQTIGRKVVLYRASREKAPQIILPKA